jgi:hypothetical protein
MHTTIMRVIITTPAPIAKTSTFPHGPSWNTICNKISSLVGFEVITTASIKKAVFWVVAPSCLVEV